MLRSIKQLLAWLSPTGKHRSPWRATDGMFMTASKKSVQLARIYAYLSDCLIEPLRCLIIAYVIDDRAYDYFIDAYATRVITLYPMADSYGVMNFRAGDWRATIMGGRSIGGVPVVMIHVDVMDDVSWWPVYRARSDPESLWDQICGEPAKDDIKACMEAMAEWECAPAEASAIFADLWRLMRLGIARHLIAEDVAGRRQT